MYTNILMCYNHTDVVFRWTIIKVASSCVDQLILQNIKEVANLLNHFDLFYNNVKLEENCVAPFEMEVLKDVSEKRIKKSKSKWASNGQHMANRKNLKKLFYGQQHTDFEKRHQISSKVTPNSSVSSPYL